MNKRLVRNATATLPGATKESEWEQLNVKGFAKSTEWS